MLKYLLKREQAVLLITFLLTLFVIYNFGILSREFEWYGFLQYYPFRVLDGMLPLMLWIGVVLLFQKLFSTANKYSWLLILTVPILIGLSNYVTDRFRPNPTYSFRFKSFIDCMLKTEPRLTAYYLREQKNAWLNYASSKEIIGIGSYETADLVDMHRWIKEHTPTDAVFIVPITDYCFSLRTERDSFVTGVFVPLSSRIFDWKERLVAINRGPLKSVGFELGPEITSNYRKLTEGDLIGIKLKYGSNYILTASEVQLKFRLLYENASYRLYEL